MVKFVAVCIFMLSCSFAFGNSKVELIDSTYQVTTKKFGLTFIEILSFDYGSNAEYLAKGCTSTRTGHCEGEFEVQNEVFISSFKCDDNDYTFDRKFHLKYMKDPDNFTAKTYSSRWKGGKYFDYVRIEEERLESLSLTELLDELLDCSSFED